MRTFTMASLLLGMAWMCTPASATELEDAQADFERLAGELNVLQLSDVLYDRFENSHGLPPETKELHHRVLEKVTNGSYSQETLQTLLKDPNAKVRTLAAVALFDMEDPAVLPTLVELVDDDAATFEYVQPWASAAFEPQNFNPPTNQQTVGDVVNKMVRFYMSPSGFHYGVVHKTEPGFAEYWEARRSRESCAAWFGVQLARASQSRFPMRPDRIPHVREIRQRIEQLPPDEQAWVFLWLSEQPGRKWLVSDEELLDACRSLGPDKMLRMLQHEIPSDDPDLQSRKRNNSSYHHMQIYVLKHAEQLLRPTDADALLQCEQWERDYQKHNVSDPLLSPWWAIAAAQLQPDKAAEILHAAMARFQRKYDTPHQALLGIALWQLCGDSEKDYFVQWFYNVKPERANLWHTRGRFIEEVGKRRNGREILAPIIQDKRFDQLSWQSLKSLIGAVNASSETPLVSYEELRKAYHPLGKDHYYWEKERARKEYPEETATFEGHLKDWRERLRNWAE
ncbi:HEAT repeat domain-containing protein [Bremerella sp. T1]|uniref:HEAT repeat domain-containing protein n=1 Tax=Bremerella sp. TYQ1 TaxID=3119568 RepID=UPI001CC942C3|nr:HEAT repeat domain-containing protein [Bremerella volcania]UBM37527.1 HEAT repeat domain-containing protein [Bremerella volcania]